MRSEPGTAKTLNCCSSLTSPIWRWTSGFSRSRVSMTFDFDWRRPMTSDRRAWSSSRDMLMEVRTTVMVAQ